MRICIKFSNSIKRAYRVLLLDVPFSHGWSQIIYTYLRVLSPLYSCLSTKKHVYGQLRGTATYLYHKELNKHIMSSKHLVLLLEWQLLVECCCHSSESQMVAVAYGYCLMKLSVFSFVSVQQTGNKHYCCDTVLS